MIEVSDDIQKAVAKEFAKRYPDFHGSERNAKLLRETVEKYTDAGCSFSVDTLSNAYHHLQALGALEQPEREVIELSNEERVRFHQIDTLAKNAERMTDYELEKSLLSAGIYVSSRSTI